MVAAQVGICGPPGAERGDPVQDRHALSHERSADHGSEQPAAGKADQRRSAPENTCSKHQLDFLQFRDSPPDLIKDRGLLPLVIILRHNHSIAPRREPVMASVNLYLLYQYAVFCVVGYPGAYQDCVGIGKGKSVCTAHCAEDPSDADIVFQVV